MPRVIPTKVLGDEGDLPPSTAMATSTAGTAVAPALVTPTKEELTTSNPDDNASSGSDDPWDVQQSRSEDASSTTATRPKPRNYPTNEVAKLPALETNRKMLSKGRRSVRPLSPPSRKGMKDKDYQDDDDTRDTMEEYEEEIGEDEMPMDEHMEYKRQRELLLCGAADENGLVGGDNLCEYTLSALGDICGVTSSTTTKDGQPVASPPRQPYTPRATTKRQETLNKAKAIRAKLHPQRAPYGVEEQTAIEVEYVEPDRKKGAPKALPAASSPKRKNMLVQAMARRAKQDFESQKGKPATVSKRDSAAADTTEVTPDNVYASFSPSEKRKFLQFINNGLSPAEATEQVLKDRPAAASPDGSSNNKSSKGGRLAFWKRSGNATDPPTAKETTKAEASTTPATTEEGFAKSGINYYDAVRRAPDDEEEPELSTTTADRKNKRKAKTKIGFSKLGAQDPPAENTRSLVTTQEEAPKESGVAVGAVAGAVAATAAVATTVAATYDDDDDDSLLRDDDDDLPAKPHPFKEAGEENAPSEEDIDLNVPSKPHPFKEGGEEEKRNVEDELEREMAAAILDVSENNAAALAAQSPERNLSVEDILLDVDTTYMNSTEIMSHYGGGSTGPGDQSISGRSYKTSGTYGTAGTNYTTSTRTRRPGAAVQRLTSQKTGEIAPEARKYKGWQESIQAAAVGIDRVWDPVHGWIDYRNPEEAELAEDEKKSEEKISISVDSLKRAQGTPEREAVVASSGVEASPPSQMEPPAEQAPEATSRSIGMPSGAAGEAKSRGWMETMKEATAKINTEGKRWDPERGWVATEDGKGVLPHGDNRYGGGVATQAESDTQDFGTTQSQDALMPLPSAIQGTQSRRDPGGKVLVSDEDHQSVDASTKSATTGRYIQIGDTGSVSSYYYGKKSNKDGAAAPGTATGPADSNQKSALVNVKKEKVNSAEAGLFPNGSTRSSRRGTGPVDLDEIDDLENGSFEAAPDFSWDEDTSNLSDANAPSSGGKKSTVPKKRTNAKGSEFMSGSSPDKSSQSVISSGSSTIPKLRASKRDTSPIRGRGSGSDIGEPNMAAEARSPPQEGIVIETARQGADPAGTLGVVSPLGDSPEQKAQQNPPGSGPDRSLKAPGKSPGTYAGSETSTPGSVKSLHEYWERRSQGEVSMPQSAEWKSFLTKKVRAETAAAVAQRKRSQQDDDRDSLFDFNESESGVPTKREPAKKDKTGLRSLEEISDISPIKTVHEDDDDGTDTYDTNTLDTISEASTSAMQGKTFLQRLQACAAPIMPKTTEGGDGINCDPGMPMAHLAFMRNNSAATGSTQDKKSSNISRFVPPALCGKPDIIVEEDENELALGEEDTDPKMSGKKSGSRSLSNPRSGRQGADVSSVISDELAGGNKTAYLEAIAMKAAVSGSKKSRKSRGAGSDVSGSTTSKHSESWQRFLDKKKGNAVPQEGQVSEAAEKYASEKVEEMMGLMAARSKSSDFQARPAEEATGAFPSVSNARSYANESRAAAEDLAAARVEAMMQALSSQPLAEGEEEI